MLETKDKEAETMKVVVLSPFKVFLTGVLSALLIGASVLGALALVGVFSSEKAEAYGAAGVGAKAWFFAEGYTGAGFEEWILIYNPPASVGGSGHVIGPTIYMYGPTGEIGTYNVPGMSPGTRFTVNINDAAAFYGYSGDISIVVRSLNYPFICERALYFDYKGQWTGGSQILGYNEGPNE